MGMIRTLQNHGDAIPDDVRDQMLQASFSRGRDLERLIDRLLRGARAELAGARQRAELRQVVATALIGFDHTREMDLSGLPDLEIDVDTVALQDVIGNLVENAISHSPAGTPITIRAQVVGRDLRLSVANIGALPPDVDPANLFLPFQRGSNATSSGVGLGLYIAARLAEAMHGRMDVETDDDHVRFVLAVPINHVEEVLPASRGIPGAREAVPAG